MADVESRLPSGMPWYVLPLMGMTGEAIFVAGLVLSYRLENPTLFNVALGAAIGQAQMVISYFFGSSAGSKTKDDAMTATSIKQNETIAEQGKALATSTPTPPTVTTVTSDPGPPPTTTVTTAPAPEPPAVTTPPGQPPGNG